jgi:hypothetical protein
MVIAMIHVVPQPGVALVKLPVSDYGAIPVPERSHDSLTWGTVISLHEDDKKYEYLIGRTAYWRKYKDDARVKGDDKLVFIEINDILGSSYDDSHTNSSNG